MPVRPVCQVFVGQSGIDVTYCDAIYTQQESDTTFEPRTEHWEDIVMLSDWINNNSIEILHLWQYVLDLPTRPEFANLQSQFNTLSNDVTQIGLAQSSLSGSVSELYARLGQLETWQAQVAPVIDLLNPDFINQQIQAVVGPLQEQVNQASQRITDITEFFNNKINETLANAQNYANSLINNLQQSVASQFNSVAQTISQLISQSNQTLSALDALNQLMQQQLQQIPSLISAYVDPKIQALEDRISQIVFEGIAWDTFDIIDKILESSDGHVEVSRIRER